MKKGNSVEKSVLKNEIYSTRVSGKFLKGEYPEEELKEEQKFGVHSMKVSVGLRGNEESEPYRVNAFYFSEGNGLYLILAYQELEAVELFKNCWIVFLIVGLEESEALVWAVLNIWNMKCQMS
ncbi:MAG: hypothetical protein ACLR2E_11280 [Lachnospiraceae bacterium]